jgi:hypothetical protein
MNTIIKTERAEDLLVRLADLRGGWLVHFASTYVREKSLGRCALSEHAGVYFWHTVGVCGRVW